MSTDKKPLLYEDQKSLAVKYDGQVVEHYRPDFTRKNKVLKVLIEIKAIPFMGIDKSAKIRYHPR